MNADKRRREECIRANCGLTKERCLIHYGNDCIKLGGTKIPVQSGSASQRTDLSISAQTTFKPYFIVDGHAETEGREFD